MRAIILAAGEGHRLRPLTNSIPKCMVKYRNKSILSYQISTMQSLGITDINIIAGYRSEVIKDLGYNTIVNSDYGKTNMVFSLFCAEKLLNQDLIISYGDILYGQNTLRKVLSDFGEISIAISTNWLELWKRRMDNPLSDAESLKIGVDGNIRELGNKTNSYENIEGQYMGLMKIKKKILPNIIRKYYDYKCKNLDDISSFNNMYMTTFLQNLINDGFKLSPVKITDEWLEVDQPNDLLVNINI